MTGWSVEEAEVAARDCKIWGHFCVKQEVHGSTMLFDDDDDQHTYMYVWQIQGTWKLGLNLVVDHCHDLPFEICQIKIDHASDQMLLLLVTQKGIIWTKAQILWHINERSTMTSSVLP